MYFLIERETTVLIGIICNILRVESRVSNIVQCHLKMELQQQELKMKFTKQRKENIKKVTTKKGVSCFVFLCNHKVCIVFQSLLNLDYEYEEGEEEEEGEGFSSFSENPLMQAMLARLGQLGGAKSSQPSTSTSPEQNGDNSLQSNSASSNNEASTSSVASNVKKPDTSSAAKQNEHHTSSNGGSRKSSQDGRTPSPSKLSTYFYSISKRTKSINGLLTFHRRKRTFQRSWTSCCKGQS